MRTTITIDDELLAAAKVRAAATHQTIGAVLEEALRKLLLDAGGPESRTHVALPDFGYEGGLLPGVDLYDKELMAQVLGDNGR